MDTFIKMFEERMWNITDVHRHSILTGKSLGKRPLGKPRCQDIIKVDFGELGCEDRRYITLAKDGSYWQISVLAVLIDNFCMN